MPAISKELVPRYLSLILPELSRNNTHLTVDELARKLEITPGDVQLLLDCILQSGTDHADLPSFYLTSTGTIVVCADLPHLQRPVRLARRETAALIAAFDAMGLDHDHPLRTRLLDAWGAPQLDLAQTERTVKHATSVANDLMTSIIDAISRQQVLEISYTPRRSGQPSVRIVEPYATRIHNDHWYLLAWCDASEEFRYFKLDRIAVLKTLGRTFEKRPLDDHEFLPLESARKATLLVHDRSILEEFSWPGACVQEAPDGTLTMTVPYLNDVWLPKQVAAALGAVELVDPPALRARVREEAALLRARAATPNDNA